MLGPFQGGSQPLVPSRVEGCQKGSASHTVLSADVAEPVAPSSMNVVLLIQGYKANPIKVFIIIIHMYEICTFSSNLSNLFY